MNIISLKLIQDFCRKHAEAKESLLSWYQEASSSDWNTPQDIRNRYSSASFTRLKREKFVIFNIKGNKYRLVTKIAYNTKTVFIKWIGTHAEYNKMNFGEGK